MQNCIEIGVSFQANPGLNETVNAPSMLGLASLGHRSFTLCMGYLKFM